MKLEQNVLNVDRCPKCHDDDLVFKYWEADEEPDHPNHVPEHIGAGRDH
jgi:hypothetical protein